MISIRILSTLATVSMMAACAGAETVCTPESLAVETSRVMLEHSDGRVTQVDLWSPSRAGQFPLLVFSHGAYSAPERYDVLLEAMASSGFVVAAPLHIDSELLVTGEQPPHHEVWATRKEDVQVLPQRVTELQSRLALASISDPQDGFLAAGHSYGALVAQVMADTIAVGDSPLPSETLRPDAVIAFSPPGPMPGFVDAASWQGISVPQLVLTGTADILPGFLEDWRLHTTAYEQAQPGDQWLWIGTDVDHYFGNIFGRKTRDVAPQSQQYDDAIAVMRRFMVHYEQSKLSCSEPLQTFDRPLSQLQQR